MRVVYLFILLTWQSQHSSARNYRILSFIFPTRPPPKIIMTDRGLYLVAMLGTGPGPSNNPTQQIAEDLWISADFSFASYDFCDAPRESIWLSQIDVYEELRRLQNQPH